MKAKLRGDWEHKPIGHAVDYYMQRDTFLDAWGPLDIAATSQWGFFNTVLTASHNPNPGHFGEVVFRPVVVRDHAWITTNCTLYNCEIGEHAIVAAGSVVCSRDVPAWTIVEGNPAQIIARYDHEHQRWVYQEPEALPRRRA